MEEQKKNICEKSIDNFLKEEHCKYVLLLDKSKDLDSIGFKKKNNSFHSQY